MLAKDVTSTTFSVVHILCCFYIYLLFLKNGLVFLKFSILELTMF